MRKTLKTGDKSRAYKLSHKGKITIGGQSDFVVEGCNDEIAEIQRKFRRFILLEKISGIIPTSLNPTGGKIPLNYKNAEQAIKNRFYSEQVLMGAIRWPSPPEVY